MQVVFEATYWYKMYANSQLTYMKSRYKLIRNGDLPFAESILRFPIVGFQEISFEAVSI